jgi:uncharacterized protein YbaR (Trm112 family)
LALLACPSCAGPLSTDWFCCDCGVRYEAPDGIPNLRLPGDTRTEVVRDFYERTPFPDYPPGASLSWLRARAERSEFARLIDRSIPDDACIVEIGCGTGQMSLYLARADSLHFLEVFRSALIMSIKLELHFQFRIFFPNWFGHRAKELFKGSVAVRAPRSAVLESWQKRQYPATTLSDSCDPGASRNSCFGFLILGLCSLCCTRCLGPATLRNL